MIDKTKDEQTERHLPSLEVAKARMHLAKLRYKVVIDKIKGKEDTDVKMSLCPYCGTDLTVEAEMFSQDKLFDQHSCRGKKR